MSMYNRRGGCYISDRMLLILYRHLLLSNKIKVGGSAHNRMKNIQSRMENKIKEKLYVTEKENIKIP